MLNGMKFTNRLVMSDNNQNQSKGIVDKSYRRDVIKQAIGAGIVGASSIFASQTSTANVKGLIATKNKELNLRKNGLVCTMPHITILIHYMLNQQPSGILDRYLRHGLRERYGSTPLD